MKESPVFVSDISFPGMIYALTVRAPVAKGVLKEIVCPPLPPSYFLVTAKDIPGENLLSSFPVPVFAEREIEYAGQPVAVLAGPDRAVLEEIGRAIEVRAEEGEPLFFGGEYTEDDVIAERNIAGGFDPQRSLIERAEKSDLNEAGEGRPALPQEGDAGFSGSGSKATKGTYVTGREEHFYAEPVGAVALPSPAPKEGGASLSRNKEKENGKEEAFTVYTATQWPWHVMRSVALALGLPAKQVTVSPTLLSLHLDGKLLLPSLTACHAALASRASGRPVKLMLTREEDFLYSPKRGKAEISLESALGEKGEILSSAINVTLDLGSAAVLEDEMIDQTCLAALGAYRHGSFTIKGTALKTNIPPQGPFAGFGLSQGFFAAELHVSRLAESIGEDPAEWRKKNLLDWSKGLAVGSALKGKVPAAELLDAAAAMSDYYRKWASYELLRTSRRADAAAASERGAGSKAARELLPAFAQAGPLRGIGISTAFQGNGFLYNDESGNGNCSIELKLEKDGSLEVRTGFPAERTGFVEIWRTMAKEILGVEPELVLFTSGTGDAPDTGAAALSRNISIVTSLFERCCQAVRRARFRNPLPITVKRQAKMSKVPGWADGKKIDAEAFSRPSWGASVTEVEIDPVSFVPRVRGVWLVVDGGRILSQGRARHSLQTGIIHALGWARGEEVRYEGGKIPGELFRRYRLPSPEEIPPIHVDFIWNDDEIPKGIGELPFCCVPASYVQAVSQAADYPFTGIPLDTFDIWNAAAAKTEEALDDV